MYEFHAYLFMEFVCARQMPEGSTISRAVQAYRAGLIAAAFSLTNVKRGEASKLALPNPTDDAHPSCL